MNSAELLEKGYHPVPKWFPVRWRDVPKLPETK